MVKFFLQRYILFATVAFLIGWYTYYAIYPSTTIPIRGDGVGYYMHLPALFIYGSLDAKIIVNEIYPEGPGATSGIVFYKPTNVYIGKYGLGEAIMMMPFFLLGHLV